MEQGRVFYEGSVRQDPGSPPEEMGCLSSSGPVALYGGTWGAEAHLAMSTSFCFPCLSDGEEEVVRGRTRPLPQPCRTEFDLILPQLVNFIEQIQVYAGVCSIKIVELA